jgi:hypothetical protein
MLYGNTNIEHECMDTVDVLGHMSSDSESTVFEVWYNLHWVVLALVSIHLVVALVLRFMELPVPFLPGNWARAEVFIPISVAVLTLVATIYFGMLHDGDNMIDSKSAAKFANITLMGGHGKGYEHFDFSMNDDPTDEEGIENIIMNDVTHSVPSQSEDRYTGWGVALIIAYCVQIISAVLYCLIIVFPTSFPSTKMAAAIASKVGSSVSARADAGAPAGPVRSVYASAAKLAF